MNFNLLEDFFKHSFFSVIFVLVCVRVRARGFRVFLPLRGFERWTMFVDSVELLRLAKRAFVDSTVEEISGSDCGRCLK